MAQPVFVSTSSTTGNISATSQTPSLPASRVNNNILLAFCQLPASTATISTSTTGWVIFASDTTNGSSVSLAWRLVDGTETAPTFTWAGAAAVHVKCWQYSGNLTSSPFGATAQASATGSTTITSASLVTTADNSLILQLLFSGGSAAIATPLPYANNGNFADGTAGDSENSGTAFVSGSTTDAVSVGVNSTTWKSFGVELLGTGSAPAGEPQIRSTNVTQQVLESISNATNIRATNVTQQVLESYTNVTNIRVTNVTLQILRSQSTPLQAQIWM